jgi:hypothetical protein
MKHLNTLSHFSLAATGPTWGINTVLLLLLQMTTASAGHKCSLYFVAGQTKHIFTFAFRSRINRLKCASLRFLNPLRFLLLLGGALSEYLATPQTERIEYFTLLTYLLLNYLLSYSMEQSPSWETIRFSASQEITLILWNGIIITAFTSARHLSLSWASSIQSMPPFPLPEDPSYYYPPIYVWVLQVVCFPTKSLNPPYVIHAASMTFFSIWSPEQYWVSSTDH